MKIWFSWNSNLYKKFLKTIFQKFYNEKLTIEYNVFLGQKCNENTTKKHYDVFLGQKFNKKTS